MLSSRIIFLGVLAVLCARPSLAGFFESLPKFATKFADLLPSSNNDEYHYMYKDGKGNNREEKRTVVNRGTPQEEFVLDGAYSVVDENGDFETLTSYSADKNGYKPRFSIKNRKLSDKSLKLLAG